MRIGDGLITDQHIQSDRPGRAEVAPIARLLLLASLAALPTGPHAAHDSEPSVVSPPPGGSALDRTLQLAGRLRNSVSSRILDTADRIDLYFGDPRMAIDHNGSFLQLDSFGRFEEHTKPAYGVLLRGKIDLPRTEDRLKLVFESEGNPADDSEELADDPIEAAGDNNYSVALRYIARQTRKLKLSLDAGVRLDTDSHLFARARARRGAEFGAWALRLSQTFTWRTDDGWSSTTGLDLDRPLSEPLFFRARSTARWTETTEQFELAQDLTLFQRLDSRNSLSYRVGARGESEPAVRSTDYLLDLRYRRRIHHQWLYLEVQPAVHWPRERDFGSVYSLLVTLSVVFGAD